MLLTDEATIAHTEFKLLKAISTQAVCRLSGYTTKRSIQFISDRPIRKVLSILKQSPIVFGTIGQHLNMFAGMSQALLADWKIGKSYVWHSDNFITTSNTCFAFFSMLKNQQNGNAIFKPFYIGVLLFSWKTSFYQKRIRTVLVQALVAYILGCFSDQKQGRNLPRLLRKIFKSNYLYRQYFL